MIKTVKRMYCDHCGKEIVGRHIQFKGNDYHAECFEAAAVGYIKNHITIKLSVFNPFSPMDPFMVLSDNGPIKIGISERYSEQFINACGKGEFKNNTDIVSEVLANMVIDELVSEDLATNCSAPDTSDELWALIQYNDCRIERKAGYEETFINQSVQIWINPVTGEFKIYAGQNTKFGRPGEVATLNEMYVVAKTHYEGVINVIIRCLESTVDYVYDANGPAFSDSYLSVSELTACENYDGLPLVKPPHDPRDGYKFDMFRGGV